MCLKLLICPSLWFVHPNAFHVIIDWRWAWINSKAFQSCKASYHLFHLVANFHDLSSSAPRSGCKLGNRVSGNAFSDTRYEIWKCSLCRRHRQRWFTEISLRDTNEPAVREWGQSYSFMDVERRKKLATNYASDMPPPFHSSLNVRSWFLGIDTV